MIELVYCADNAKYGRIAREYVHLGTQLPGAVYTDSLYFADQNWRSPDREGYLSMLAKHRPHLATVLDWEHFEQRVEVLGWAEDAAALVDVVIIIPKCDGAIQWLSDNGVRRINGKEVRLGYSVPTRYGGTMLMLADFIGWPIHALGGSPKRQLELARYLDVRSADGNYIHQKIKHGQFFDGKRWQQLADAGYQAQGRDIPETVLRLSLPNLVKAFGAL